MIRIRFAPQDGSNYQFDPTIGPGYVWHCHILDHEDNEMMRPLIIMSSNIQLSPILEVALIAVAVIVVVTALIAVRRLRRGKAENSYILHTRMILWVLPLIHIGFQENRIS